MNNNKSKDYKYMISNDIKEQLYLKGQRKVTNRAKKFIISHLKKALDDHQKCLKTSYRIHMTITRNKRPLYNITFEADRNEYKDCSYNQLPLSDLDEDIIFLENISEVAKFYNFDFDFFYQLN